MHHRTAGDRTQLAQASRSRHLHLPPCRPLGRASLAARTATQHISLQATPRLMVARSCCPTRHLPCFPQVHPCPPPESIKLTKRHLAVVPRSALAVQYTCRRATPAPPALQLATACYQAGWSSTLLAHGCMPLWPKPPCAGPHPGSVRLLQQPCWPRHAPQRNRANKPPGQALHVPCPLPPSLLWRLLHSMPPQFHPQPLLQICQATGTSSPPAAASCRHQIKCTASVPTAAAATGCHGSRLGAAAAKPVCRRTLLPPPGAPAAARHNG